MKGIVVGSFQAYWYYLLYHGKGRYARGKMPPKAANINEAKLQFMTAKPAIHETRSVAIHEAKLQFILMSFASDE